MKAQFKISILDDSDNVLSEAVHEYTPPEVGMLAGLYGSDPNGMLSELRQRVKEAVMDNERNKLRDSKRAEAEAEADAISFDEA